LCAKQGHCSEKDGKAGKQNPLSQKTDQLDSENAPGYGADSFTPGALASGNDSFGNTARMSCIGMSGFFLAESGRDSMKLTHTLIACIAMQGLIHSTQAEQPEIVVSATRTPTEKGATGSSISVITRADIDASGKTSLPDLLRGVAGLEIVQAAPGANASAFLRGAGSAQTLFLVDGMRLNAPSSGGFDFSDIALDSIERIEILRGPQSTLYGSDAMGGVINIITRKGEQTTTSWMRVEGGTLDRAGAAAGVTGQRGLFDLGASVFYEEINGLSVASEKAGNTEKDDYQNLNLALQAHTLLPDETDISLQFRAILAEKALDGFEFGVGPVDDLNYDSTRDAYHTGITLKKPLDDHIQQTVQLGFVDESLEGKDPDTAFNNFEINSQILDFLIQTDLALADAHLVSLGYEFQRLSTENVGNFDEEVDLHAVFAQHQYLPSDQVAITLGLRANDHSEFGEETTARATLSWSCPEEIMRLHSSIGSGFRSPTLNDLYFPGYGNPDLSPETSVGYDIGLEQKLCQGKLLIDLTWFANEFEDLISFDDATFTAINIDEADSQGVELSVSCRLHEAITLNINHSYTDTEDKTTGAQLARRPEHRTAVGLNYHGEFPVQANLSAVSINDRIDSSGDAMDDYTRVDLALRYTGFDHVEPFVRVDNLFDEDYEEVPGFTTPGIEAVGGIRTSW
jgi:vitamin B12 transporter